MSNLSSIRQRLSTFIRDPPSQNGLFELIDILNNYDISYFQIILNAANRYMQDIFYFWNKYKKLEKLIYDFINKLEQKSKLAPLLFQRNIEKLKQNYKSASGKQFKDSSKAKYCILQNPQKQLNDIQKSTINDTHNQIQNNLYNKYKQKQFKKIKQKIQQKQEQNQNQKSKHIQNIFSIDKYFGKCKQSKCKQPNIKQLYQYYNKIDFIFQSKQNNCFNYKNQQSQHYKLVNTLEKYKSQNDNQPRIIQHRNCLGCVTFFYQNQNMGLPCHSQNTTFFLNSIKTIHVFQYILLAQIIGYLNSNQGGFIFVGCIQNSEGKVQPIQQKIDQHQKQQIQSLIQSLVQLIHSKISAKKKIQLNFIPIAQKLFKNASDKNTQILQNKENDFTNPKWLQGRYILRLKVVSQDPAYTFYYKIQNNAHFYYKSNQNLIQLKNEDIYQFMMNKYIKYTIKKRVQCLISQGNYLPKFIDHTSACCRPQKGLPVFNKNKANNQFQKRTQKKRQDNYQREGYKSITLLVALSKSIGTISKILKQTQKIDLIIVESFPRHKFKLNTSTYLIWHNCKFDKINTAINKHKSQIRQANDKKSVSLISTASNLTVPQHFNLQKQKPIIQQQVIRQFGQIIQYYEYEQKNYKKTYIRCPSIISSVYLYFFLDNVYNKKFYFQKINLNTKQKFVPKDLKKQAKKRQNQYNDYDSDQYNNDYHKKQQYTDHKSKNQNKYKGKYKQDYNQNKNQKKQVVNQQSTNISSQQQQNIEYQLAYPPYDNGYEIHYYYTNGFFIVYNKLTQTYSQWKQYSIQQTNV